MVEIKGVPPATGVQPGEQPGTYQVKANETLGQIAYRLARQLDMPMGDQKQASIRAVLAEIYRLNPKFNPSLAADGKVESAGWSMTGQGVTNAQDPDLIIPGEILNVPTRAPVAESPTPTDTDVREDPPPATREPGTVTGPTPPDPNEVSANRTPTDERIDTDPVDPERTDGTPAERTDGAEETEKKSGFEKIFGSIRKIFKNPLFQGLMAVLNLIPGINVVVSGACAIIGLTNIISKIAQGKGGDLLKNPLEIGSTLAYIAGVFMPGLGALGGIMGMTQHLKEVGAGETEEQQAERRQNNRESTDRADRADRTDRASTTPASEDVPALTNEQLSAKLSEVQAELSNGVLADEDRFGAWLTKVGELRQQYDLLMRRAVANRDAAQALRDTPALGDLDTFLNETLPNQVAAQASDLAFGLGNLAVADAPTPGRLCRMTAATTIADYARTVPGFEGRHEQLAAAIASYNGIPASESVVKDYVLYVPTAAQLNRDQWPEFMNMAKEDPYNIRSRLRDVRAQLESVDSRESLLARQLVDLLLRMPTPPEPMPEPATDQPPA